MLFLKSVAPINPPTAAIITAITTSKLVTDISNPKTEKPEGALVSAMTEVDVDAGVTVDPAVEAGKVEVTEGVSVETVESEAALEVEVREITVDIMDADALRVAPMITMDEG